MLLYLWEDLQEEIWEDFQEGFWEDFSETSLQHLLLYLPEYSSSRISGGTSDTSLQEGVMGHSRLGAAVSHNVLGAVAKPSQPAPSHPHCPTSLAPPLSFFSRLN